MNFIKVIPCDRCGDPINIEELTQLSIATARGKFNYSICQDCVDDLKKWFRFNKKNDLISKSAAIDVIRQHLTGDVDFDDGLEMAISALKYEKF